MKTIYVEVSEDEYTGAKEIGFFEVKEEFRKVLKNLIAQRGVAHDGRKQY